MMPPFLRPVLAAAVIPLFTSCVNTSYYQGPPASGSNNAVIRNLYRSGGEQGLGQNLVIVRVDDLQADYRRVAPVKSRFALAPGPHRIQLHASSYSSLLSVPYEAFVEVPLVARSGRNYQPKGYVDGMQVILWIEDESSGKDVTGRMTAPLHLTSGYGPFRPPPLEKP